MDFGRHRRIRVMAAAFLLCAAQLSLSVHCGSETAFADEYEVVPDDEPSAEEPEVEETQAVSVEQDPLEIEGLIEAVDDAPAMDASSDPASADSSGKSEKNAKKLIVGFRQKGALASIHYEMGEKPSLEQLMQQFPSSLEVYFQEEKKAKAVSVTWVSYSDDYSSTDLNYYFFTPAFDTGKYRVQNLDLQKDMPYIEVVRDAVSYEMIESAPPKENEAAVFAYCTKKLRLNTAAACGILANIYCESGFRTNAIGDGGTSVGICQWHNGRWTKLKEYVPDDWQTLDGQLRFMRKELRTGYKDTLEYLRNVTDDEDGAYDAAYYWCMHYEMPDKTVSRSITRGYLAKNVYWPRYGMGLEEETETEQDTGLNEETETEQDTDQNGETDTKQTDKRLAKRKD